MFSSVCKVFQTFNYLKLKQSDQIAMAIVSLITIPLLRNSAGGLILLLQILEILLRDLVCCALSRQPTSKRWFQTLCHRLLQIVHHMKPPQ